MARDTVANSESHQAAKQLARTMPIERDEPIGP
jgi:hypothetical protein